MQIEHRSRLLPPVNHHLFQDVRDDEVVIYDDDGFPLMQLELEELTQ